jgi:hypothetical protein
VLWVLDADKDGMFGEEDIHSFAWMMGEYTKDWEQYQVRADTRPLVRDPPNPRQIIKLLTNPRPLPAQWRDQIKGFCYMQLYDRILSNDGKGGDSVQNATMAPQWLKDLEATRPPAPDDPSNPAAGLGVPAFQKWVEMVIEENAPRTFDHDEFPGTVFVERDTVHDLYTMFQVNMTWGTFGKRNFQDFLCWLQDDGEAKGLMPLDDDELDDFVPMETIRDMVEDIMRGYRCINIHVNTE